MRSVKVVVETGMALLAALAVAAAVSPYLAVHQLKAALLAGNEEEIRARVDFAAVRYAMVQDVSDQTTEDERQNVENGQRPADLRIGLARQDVEKVESYITPERLAGIARGRRLGDLRGAVAARPAGGDAPQRDWRIRQLSWSKCIVEVQGPQPGDGVVLCLGRRGLFSWQLERIVLPAKPKRPTGEEVLLALGCTLNPGGKDALCRVPAGFKTDTTSLQGQEMMMTHVVGIYGAGVADEARVIALVASVPAGVDNYDCGACAVLVGAVQYHLAGGRWQLDAANLAVTEGGFGGDYGPEPKITELGRGRYGLVAQETGDNHGYAGVSATLIAFHRGKLRVLGTPGYHTECPMWFGPLPYGKITSSGSWRLDTTSGGEFYDIIEEQSPAVFENEETHAKTTVAPAWTGRQVFSGDAYKSTTPRQKWC